ncbi:MAG: hypothetical protein ACRCZY_08130 [Phocaeicola sp.]
MAFAIPHLLNSHTLPTHHSKYQKQRTNRMVMAANPPNNVSISLKKDLHLEEAINKKERKREAKIQKKR